MMFKFYVLHFPMISCCYIPHFAGNSPKALTDSTRNVNCIFKITFIVGRKYENLPLNLFHTCSDICFSVKVQFLYWGVVFLFHPLSLWPLLGVSKQQSLHETLNWDSNLILQQTVVIFATGILRISDSLAGDTKLKIQSYYQSPEPDTPLTFFINLCLHYATTANYRVYKLWFYYHFVPFTTSSFQLVHNFLTPILNWL